MRPRTRTSCTGTACSAPHPGSARHTPPRDHCSTYTDSLETGSDSRPDSSWHQPCNIPGRSATTLDVDTETARTLPGGNPSWSVDGKSGNVNHRWTVRGRTGELRRRHRRGVEESAITQEEPSIVGDPACVIETRMLRCRRITGKMSSDGLEPMTVLIAGPLIAVTRLPGQSTRIGREILEERIPAG